MNRVKGCNLIVISLFIIAFLPVNQAAPEDGQGQSAQDEVFAARPAMREVTLTGYTRARHMMNILSEEAGRCIRVTADIGDTVGKDGIFFVLDKTFIDLAIEKNRIDFINKRYSAGMSRNEAIIDGIRVRLRPILLTTLTTTLGLAPMALGIPSYSIVWGTMASTFVTGLCTATFLTLFIVPIEWDLLMGLKLRFEGRRIEKK